MFLQETDLGILPKIQSYGVTLESPAGSDFDLYVYEGDANGPNCQAVPVKAGGSPEFVLEWWLDNAALDDRWITIEVRHVSGPCEAGKPWKLEVLGGQI